MVLHLHVNEKTYQIPKWIQNFFNLEYIILNTDKSIWLRSAAYSISDLKDLVELIENQEE